MNAYWDDRTCRCFGGCGLGAGCVSMALVGKGAARGRFGFLAASVFYMGRPMLPGRVSRFTDGGPLAA